MNLQAIINAITPPDEAARAAAHARWNALAKPLGSLGLLEETIERIAVLIGSPEVRLDHPMLVVCCADNGVVAQGVSQTDASVTTAVAAALARGDSTVSHMARIAGCAVEPLDVGMLPHPPIPGLRALAVRQGTADITLGPAMPREVCLRTIETGIGQVRRLRDAGTTVILAGEMGIGNTTTASAVTSVLLDLPPEQVTGRGAGLSDQGLARKVDVIRRAIETNRPDRNDPVDVLCKVGGLDLAALCGIYLGGALYGVPVVMDGFITAAAALCAVRLCPDARKAVLPSHVSAEPAGALVLKALDLKPLITAEMRLGEGGGAVAALPVLQMALAVYHSGHTFDALGIEAYHPW